MNDMISIKNINKSYHTKNGEIKAIDDFSLDINLGSVISIVGPSGCGKSTILSILANIDNDYQGTILGMSNFKYAYMLQHDALLPHLTIYENCLLGLKIKNLLTIDNINYVNSLLKLYNLEEFKNNYPKSLSGGMKQRVALIRTLATKPDLLLLDEPFCALDEQSRLLITNDIYKIIKKEKKTVILVTHNMEEAITLSDKVVVLTNRPAKIKNIIDIKLENESSVYERRKDKLFNYYFDLIWKELDNYES